MSFTKQSILFISGLDKSVNENMLYQLFNDYSISYIKIAKDHQTRESFGYAFVGFKNHTKAEEAINKLNYSKLAKKTLRISWYNREPNNYRNHPEYNIFVKKIPKEVTHQDFHEHFKKYGTIISAKLAEDDEGESMGYGFVLYDSADAAKSAIDECNGKEWKGKKIFVAQFVKNRPKKPVRYNNIYVRNIPKTWSEDDIKKYFEKYGKISSMIVRTPDASKLNAAIPEEKKKQILDHQYAFVCFESLDGPAVNAVNKVPYLKIGNDEYNKKIEGIVDMLKKQEIKEDNLYKCACYIEENNLSDKVKDENELKKAMDDFIKLIAENDNVYMIKDKKDRLDCCQALKKAERAKKLKQLYEKIKKKIKEKYKFCNLYVKNLSDDYKDEELKELFGKYGEIRSAKVVKKEMVSNYLGIKRSVKVFGFVCFFEASKAQEAKSKLNGYALNTSGPKLYVDYHQTKQERTEFLKLKLIKESERGKRIMPQIRQIPQGMYPPNMMRKMPYMPMMAIQGQVPPQKTDPIARSDYYGEPLFTKIASTPQFAEYANYFAKIVGIFLDLEDQVLDKLLRDDDYFKQQVQETIKLLTENKGQ
jgi:polyadenylate-binding protein